MDKLAVNMITYNGLSAFIKQAIGVVEPFVDEIVVCDTGSIDGTRDYLKTIKKVKWFTEDIQHLGETWTSSPKDIRLTKLLNEIKNRTESKWILKIDDDEVFPHELLREIIAMEKQYPIYSIPFLHVGRSSNLYSIKRLFKNVPVVKWEGIYGTETLTYNGRRVSSKKCPSTKNFFIHLGELRKDMHDRKHRYRTLQG